MYFYFFSSFPSAIKIGGIYFGTLHIDSKFINLDISKPILIEVVSLNTMYESINFILDDNFESIENDSISITDLKGGFLLHFSSPPQIKEFSVLSQQKYNDCVVTVFTENGYKLSIETPNDFYAQQFEFCIEKVIISRLKNNLLALQYTLKNLNILQIFDVKSKIKCLLQVDYTTCELDNNIKTTLEYKDIVKHKITSIWEYDGNLIKESEHSVSRFKTSQLISSIIPFAFCEEMLVNGDLSEFLSGNVLENKNKLKSFFGEFIGVMPPPIFRDINEVGFIYKKNSTRFYVEYYVFEIIDNKIVNIFQK